MALTSPPSLPSLPSPQLIQLATEINTDPTDYGCVQAARQQAQSQAEE